MRGVSGDGQICAAEGVADAGMEVLLPASKQSVGAMDPKAPGWIKRYVDLQCYMSENCD